ncbi:MAG: thioredoxin fold domain-containing protein [Gammaproteobacteria bacterium]|nr:thioredoxin fold domain-containing protein [Gammaproteobacteria bacterium]
MRKIASAWCAKDPGRHSAHQPQERRGDPENVCADNPVAAQILLGEKAGVNGTPALVLEDGTLVPGYRPAKELAGCSVSSERGGARQLRPAR